MHIYKIKFHTLYVLAIFLLSIGSAKTSIVFDIDKHRDGDREIVAFHTGKQMLVHHEVMTHKKNVDVTFELRNLFSVECSSSKASKDAELSYELVSSPDGSLTINGKVTDLVSVDHYIILSNWEITRNVPGSHGYSKFLKKWFWSSKPIVEKTPAQIKKMITGMKDKQKNDADLYLTRDDSNRLITLESLSDKAKGVLGELLTGLTLFSFGYEQLPSIYKSNNGLDGVFRSLSGAYLLLTQSKAGNSNPMAKTVIANELSEHHVYDRMQLMKTKGSIAVKATYQVILDFLQDRPEHIYKMAQCLFTCGFADLRIMPVEFQKFPKNGIKLYNAPRTIKVEDVQATVTAYEPDAKKQVDLLLDCPSIAALSTEELMLLIMKKRDVEGGTQKAVLKILAGE
jgi:hypothetical protein